MLKVIIFSPENDITHEDVTWSKMHTQEDGDDKEHGIITTIVVLVIQIYCTDL